MPIEPVSLSQASAILLPDGVWYPVSSSLGAVLNPVFMDPTQTGPDGGPVLIAPGEPWVQFIDVGQGQAYGAPFRSVVAVQLAAPVAQLIMPKLVEGAVGFDRRLAVKFRPAEHSP